jgi:hypothetical protein
MTCTSKIRPSGPIALDISRILSKSTTSDSVILILFNTYSDSDKIFGRSEQSYKGKFKTHKYINRQNQSTTMERCVFKHILLFNKKQMDRTQVSQLRNDFSKINTMKCYKVEESISYCNFKVFFIPYKKSRYN